MFIGLTVLAGLSALQAPPESLEASAIRVAAWWQRVGAWPSREELPRARHEWGEAVERGDVIVGFGTRVRSSGADEKWPGDDLFHLRLWWDARDQLRNGWGDELWCPPPSSFEACMFSIEECHRAATITAMQGGTLRLLGEVKTGNRRLDRASFAALPDEVLVDGWGRRLQMDPIVFVSRAGVDVGSREIDSTSGEELWRAYVLFEPRGASEPTAALSCIVEGGGPLTLHVIAKPRADAVLQVDGASPTGYTLARAADLSSGKATLEFGTLSPGPIMMRVHRIAGPNERIIAACNARIGVFPRTESTLELFRVEGKVLCAERDSDRVLHVRLEDVDGPLTGVANAGDSCPAYPPGHFSLWCGAGHKKLVITEGRKEILREDIEVVGDLEHDIDLR